MKLNSIFSRYLLREMLPPFCISVMFFSFIFLLTRILDITNMIVNYKIGVSAVFLMIVYTMPYFLVFVIPMSVMMTVLLTLLRLSDDNEIIALKAGGISLYRLLPPVFMFCLMGCLLTGFMSICGLPWGKLSLKALTVEVATSNLNIGLKERTFNDSFKGVMLYVNKVDMKDKTLKDVFIEDRRSKNLVITIVSPEGYLAGEPGKAVFHLRLSNGIINQVDIEKRSVNSIRFDTYTVNLDLQKALDAVKGGPKDEKEMSLAELIWYLEEDRERDGQYYETLLEFHKKFSIPFACFSLGLLAVPLGVQSSRSAKRSFSLGLGLGFFLFYYLLLSAGLVFGEAGVYPPLIGMWVPNIVTGAAGLYLLIRTVNDRPVQFEFLRNTMRWIKSRFIHK
ncbi:LPS export ABC transporter permease LptF [Desulfobacterales bacterium HSG2]|nr:LPS export ABC transporter permease LptF [Desulfobacterales bacterium HSG2]